MIERLKNWITRILDKSTLKLLWRIPFVGISKNKNSKDAHKIELFQSVFIQNSRWIAFLITSWGITLGNLQAATTATATVTYSVSTITAITVSGNPAALNITTAAAGNPPTSVSDSSTTYSITTNDTSQRITASIDTAMNAGVTLSVNLTAPSGATSSGAVNLTTTSQNLVTGITGVAQSNLGITYTLSATAAAGPISSTTRTVTYTIGP